MNDISDNKHNSANKTNSKPTATNYYIDPINMITRKGPQFIMTLTCNFNGVKIEDNAINVNIFLPNQVQ